MSKRQRSKPSKPSMSWQIGEYERMQKINHRFPLPVLLLCKLMNVTPEQLLIDFMDNLAHASWNRKGRDEAKRNLVDYFIAHGYGQHYYTAEEIRQMFQEMDAVGMLFPFNAQETVIDAYSAFRETNQKYWFEKWFYKHRREL